MLVLEKCHKVYLEGYTVDFPYDIKELKLGKKIKVLERKDVESNMLIKEAKGRNVALLVYGSPLFATTHMSIILDAKDQKINVEVIYSASIFDAVAETGLQLYKFGKTASMPKEDADFLKYIKENLSIKAHSLILVDIGMDFKKAIEKLEKAVEKQKIEVNKMVVCSKLGTEEPIIFYGTLSELKDKELAIQAPFCFIIPSELHFLEEEGLKRFG